MHLCVYMFMTYKNRQFMHFSLFVKCMYSVCMYNMYVCVCV